MQYVIYGERMQEVLNVRDASKAYGEDLILKHVNMTIKTGQTIGIIGKNGSGKTTFLNLLSGDIKPSGGSVQVAMQDRNLKEAYTHRTMYRRFFGFGRQEPSFYSQLTVTENLDYFGSQYGLSKRILEENKEWLLESLTLKEHRDKLASDLSGGMRKRLDIACSLVHKPNFAFFDEPTADLDPGLRSDIWNFIKSLSDDGITVILSTHDMKRISSICDKILVLKDGWVDTYSTPSKILKNLDNPSIVTLVSQDIDLENLTGTLNIGKQDTIITVDSSILKIRTRNPVKIQTAILKKIKNSTAYHLTITQAGLEALIK